MTDWREVDAPSPARVRVGWVAAGLVLPLLLLAVPVAGYLLLADRLPDPIAVHWGLGGVADGTVALTPFVTGLSVVGATGIAVSCLISARALAEPRQLRMRLTIGSAIVAIVPAALLLTLFPNLDATSWQQADSPGVELALVLVIPAGTGLASWWLAARPARLLAVAPAVPADALRAAEPTYQERVTMAGLAWWLLGLAAAALLAWLAHVFVTVVLLLVAVAFGWFGVYRYQVSGGGLQVRFGPIGSLGRRVPVEEMLGAQPVALRPRDWGGWGYRGTSRDWAVVTSAGPAVRLDLAGERSLTLSSDDPAGLSGALNSAVLAFWRSRGNDPHTVHP